MPIRPRMSDTPPIRMMMSAMGAKNELVENATSPMIMKKNPPMACHIGVDPIKALWVPAGATTGMTGAGQGLGVRRKRTKRGTGDQSGTATIIR